MELDLCLALPNHSPNMDLNCTRSSSSSTNSPKRLFVDNDDHESCVNNEVESKALPLLSWSGQPNREDDDNPSEKWIQLRLNHHQQNNEEDEEIVGWPPINTLRKELVQSRRGPNHRPIGVRNSMYVKVKMEGMPIGRKIDLTLFNSYQSLIESLIHMFDKYNKIERNNGGNYTILYQDKEGDWMLAGDAPWETFIESVQRIEILRNDY